MPMGLCGTWLAEFDGMKRLAGLAISVAVLVAQTPQYSVTAVRHWSSADVTRVAIEVTGDFKFRSDRLHDPERVYFDILNARPRFENRRIYSETIDDKKVQRLRVAETTPGVTRVVLDLAVSVEVSTSQLTNPNRLIIELRMGTAAPAVPTVPTLPATAPATTPKPAAPPPGVLTDPATPPKTPTVTKADTVTPVATPTKLTLVQAKTEIPEKIVPAPAVLESAKPEPEASTATSELGKAARHTSTGGVSLVRALGLKIGRVVIDPGHGGHDQGTEGPHGLLEKELVLDVSQRVGKLIEDRMGAEVIYTRTDDSFIPLEGRTALANDKKADLFLSIHANSSSLPRIAGMETYYLNFNPSKEALDVAARENATSQKSIFDLQDMVQEITLHDKVEESREFAGRVQAALYGFSAHNFPALKNRGVKKAPFVVLIGAKMPSVLAEIGFLSNPREEALLKKSDYRQKLAEALYRGISRYAETLSHFQLAKNQ
jgi:N-acetylmuramoyl-L-alanine amidase